MPSLINELEPVEGNPTTQAVRENFLAAKTEIEELQSHIDFTFILFTANNVSMIWTNMPSALTLIPTWYASIKLIDTTSYSQIRLFVAKGTVAGFAGSRVRLGFNPIAENVPANYIDPCLTPSYLPVDNVSQLLDTGWLDLDPALKGEGFLGVLGELGDGVVDPVFFGAYAMLK